MALIFSMIVGFGGVWSSPPLLTRTRKFMVFLIVFYMSVTNFLSPGRKRSLTPSPLPNAAWWWRTLKIWDKTNSEVKRYDCIPLSESHKLKSLVLPEHQTVRKWWKFVEIAQAIHPWGAFILRNFVNALNTEASVLCRRDWCQSIVSNILCTF